MKKRRGIGGAILVGAGMILLILNAPTAMAGASDGVRLCIQTVIPSLFPFMVLSMVMTGALSQMATPWMRPIGVRLKLPPNAESIYLVGLLGGYPIGAQGIRHAYDRGQLSRESAQRMLSFCNNAGPAFVFGMGSHLLGSTWECFIVWLIHIISSMTVGIITPAPKQDTILVVSGESVSFPEAVRRGAEAMLSVCGWIVLFRTGLQLLGHLGLGILPRELAIAISGLLEMTNGCAELESISSIGVRFVLFSGILGFGGLCVGLQTKSVLLGSDLTVGSYIRGKALQGLLSIGSSLMVANRLDGNPVTILLGILLIPSVVIMVYHILFERKGKLGMEIGSDMMYTDHNVRGGITYEVVSEKG